MRPPQGGQHDGHDSQLVEIVPRLDEHRVEPPHQEFVVEAADGPEQCAEYDAEDPAVMFEVDTFLPSRAAQHQERHGGEDDADPLPEVQPFAEDQHRTNEHHDRPCRH